MANQQESAEEIFGAALDLPPEQRPAYLAAACRGSVELRHMVEALLLDHERLGNFLTDSPLPPPLPPTPSQDTITLLTPGRKLGRYTILAPLGSGGMGAVYQARDERLERVVAIKILSPDLFHGEASRDRFRKEALALARLSHANIAAVYDVGEENGVDYIVMECIAGETLAAKLKLGPLPIPDAVSIAQQVAGALEEAHASGVIHRDLKPANIMVTAKGNVKVLDFGIAKLAALETPNATMTGGAGTIIGTPLYMSPEQVQGKKVDTRTDLWSLGVVLYESLTGRAPFHRESSFAIMHAIVEQTPAPVSQLRPEVQPAVDHIVTRLLQKDPGSRYQSAKEVARDSSTALTTNAPTSKPTPSPLINRRTFLWTAGATAAAGTGIWIARSHHGRSSSPAMHITVQLLSGTVASDAETGQRLGPPSIAPDGSAMVVSLRTHEGTYLFLRHLNSELMTRMDGTLGAGNPFWSPDSQHIGFFAGAKLKRMPAVGGSPIVLCDAAENRGGAWSSRGIILFAPNLHALFKVPENGGTPEPATQLHADATENSHRFPVFLPDGNHFLYFARTDDLDKRGIFLESLDGKQTRRRVLVADGQFALGLDPDAGQHYLFTQQTGKIVAQTFNVDSGVVSGSPHIMLDRAGQVTVSDTGVLVVRTQGIVRTTLTWRDRAGRQLSVLGEPDDYYQLALSHSGRFAAVVRHDSLNGIFKIWIASLPDGRLEPFSDLQHATAIVWSHDGSTLYTQDARTGKLFRSQLEPRGPEQSLQTLPDGNYLRDVSPLGGDLLVERSQDNAHATLAWSHPDPLQWHPLDASGPMGMDPTLSPDGKLLAFASDKSGKQEIYIMDFPNGTDTRRISTNGGYQPHWRNDGKELFYIAADEYLMAAELTPKDITHNADPKPLFRTNLRGFTTHPLYDASPDGQRFLLIERDEASGESTVEMILNWPSLLPQ